MSFDLNAWPWKFALMAALLVVRQAILLSTRGADGRPNETGKSVVETIDSIAMAIGLVLFVIQPFLLQAFFIPSSSMENTLQISDRLLVSKLIYRLRPPQFQDVVVFRAPPEATQGTEMAHDEDTDFIKRCMGTPGDIVYVTKSTVYRQASGTATAVAVKEPYTKTAPGIPQMAYEMKIVDGEVYERDMANPTGANPFASGYGPWTLNYRPVDIDQQLKITQAKPGAVPPGRLLMMGDNRNNSRDSHVWGLLARERVVGKAICVFWPLTRIAMVRNLSFLPPPTPPAPLMARALAAP